MKRLFKVKEGAKISGVCNGLSEYLNIDVSLIRLLFIILAFTSIAVFVYIVLMVILPEKKYFIN